MVNKIVREYQIVAGRKFSVPLCSVFLLTAARRTEVVGMVDSGADRSIFHEKIAEDAGIDLSGAPVESLQYGSGRTTGRVRWVWMDFGPETRRIEIEVLFVKELHLHAAWLGRVGFFDQFNEVAFLQRKTKTPRVELRW